MKVLYYPQISSIANDKCILNTEATFNIMLTFIKCINEFRNDFQWIFLVPEKSEFTGDVPFNVEFVKIPMYLDSKIGRYDFNALIVKGIIEKYKPDVIINNNPTLTRNIRILAPNTPIIQKNDFQGHGLSDDINYLIRQVDGVISSDVSFEITQANKNLFIKNAAKKFNNSVIKILKNKINVIRQGAYAKEIDELKKLYSHGRREGGVQRVVFPGRIGTTNYNHWQDMVNAIAFGNFNPNDFHFIFTNPTKEKGKDILIKYLESIGVPVVKENLISDDYIDLVLSNTKSISLFKYPDVRDKYIGLLCYSNIGVQMFDKNEEPHGGIACREMAWCNIKLVLSDTFKINGFVDDNYKFITDMSVKDIEKKIKAIAKEDRTKIKYDIETMEEGSIILYDTIVKLFMNDTVITLMKETLEDAKKKKN